MIKIYFNRVSAILANEEESLRLFERYSGHNPVLIQVDEHFSPKKFFQDFCRKKNVIAILQYRHPKELLKRFMQDFRLVEAAGGVVFNEDGEILMIYRRGNWDFPKGKIDPGESPRQAALREIKEETGLKHLKIIGKQEFPDLEQEGTLHLYKENGEYLMKLTHWFEVEGSKKDSLKPEEREGIEKVKWIDPAFFPAYLEHSYLSIRDLAFRYC